MLELYFEISLDYQNHGRELLRNCSITKYVGRSVEMMSCEIKQGCLISLSRKCVYV